MSDEKVVYEVRLSKPVRCLGMALTIGLCLNAGGMFFHYVSPAHAMSIDTALDQIIDRIDELEEDLENVIGRSCG